MHVLRIWKLLSEHPSTAGCGRRVLRYAATYPINLFTSYYQLTASGIQRLVKIELHRLGEKKGLI